MMHRLWRLLAFALLAVVLPAPAATTQLPITLHSGTGTGAALRCVGAPSTAPACGYATREACDAAAAQRKLASYVCKAPGKWVADAPPPPAPPAVTWTQCAREGQRCEFSGRREVRYTAVGGASVRQISKVAEGGVGCTDAPFGAAVTDYENLCSYSSATTTAPVTVLPDATPAPEPTPAPQPVPMPTPGSAGPRVASFTPSGPITATAGQVIAGVRISNAGGNCITIPQGASGVVVRDSEIGPCGGDASVAVYGNGALVEHVRVTAGARGVFIVGSNATVRMSVFEGPFRDLCENEGRRGHCSHAIEAQRATSGIVEGNVVRGSGYQTDAVSMYESSGMRLVGNDIDVQIDEWSGAGFTMGDSTTGNPGRDNYVARNTVRQRGGVPAGVFGSNGNTVLEKNCLTAGIQAYNYSGVFDGVTVRDNVINMAASYVRDPKLVAGWSTNIDSTDCSKVPG